MVENGAILCMSANCSNRMAVTILLSDSEIYHVVTVGLNNFTLRHPTIERINGDLFDCALTDRISRYKGGKPGVYRIYGSADDHWEALSLETLS